MASDRSRSPQRAKPDVFVILCLSSRKIRAIKMTDFASSIHPFFVCLHVCFVLFLKLKITIGLMA